MSTADMLTLPKHALDYDMHNNNSSIDNDNDEEEAFCFIRPVF